MYWLNVDWPSATTTHPFLYEMGRFLSYKFLTFLTWAEIWVLGLQQATSLLAYKRKGKTSLHNGIMHSVNPNRKLLWINRNKYICNGKCFSPLINMCLFLTERIFSCVAFFSFKDGLIFRNSSLYWKVNRTWEQLSAFETITENILSILAPIKQHSYFKQSTLNMDFSF